MKIIYLRTSTEEQNPQNQLRDCKTLVGEQFEVYEEKQSAFKSKERPIFQSIKERIQKRNVSELIVWDLDRLFRNRKRLVEFFQFCKVYNCKIISYRQQWLNQLNQMPEPFNEIMHNLMLQIMGWIAEDESKKKSERVKIAFQNSTKKWGRKPIKNLDKDIKRLHEEGCSVRDIASKIFYWDEQRNKKFVSKSYVHKIIKRFQRDNFVKSNCP